MWSRSWFLSCLMVMPQNTKILVASVQIVWVGYGCPKYSVPYDLSAGADELIPIPKNDYVYFIFMPKRVFQSPGGGQPVLLFHCTNLQGVSKKFWENLGALDQLSAHYITQLGSCLTMSYYVCSFQVPLTWYCMIRLHFVMDLKLEARHEQSQKMRKTFHWNAKTIKETRS